MSTRFYGAVVKVRDMDRCRAFYANVIGLGEPVIDSNFWVEFEVVPGAMVLALEQSNSVPEDPAERGGGQVAWCLEVEDLTAFRQQLAGQGCPPQSKTALPAGPETLTFLDPEGNAFMAVEKKG
jgi:catechol-2,3-dioxygenase